MSYRASPGYRKYKDPFTHEGRALIEAAKFLVITAHNEVDRAEKAQELKRVLDYVRQNHLRKHEDIYPRSGVELLFPSVEGRKPLQ